MIFNYDPILGLQYQSIQDLHLKVDVNGIPKDFDYPKFIKMAKEIGFIPVDFSKQAVEEISPSIYHNLLQMKQ